MSNPGLTPKRVTVLRELAWLCSGAPEWASEAQDGYWLPYHLRFFRAQGRAGEAGSFVYAAGLSVGAAAAHLRKLAGAGLAQQRRGRGRSAYKITDAGREALAEWDRSHVEA